ncbi:MAG TPA: PH domain-containing protein [Candidatus Thermoplasmatota archaeon]|nr:PH domain-containing protein [Candidatus Thermoplasmatota archaeon]
MDAPGLSGVGRFTGRRELAALQPHLEEGEDVRHAVAGTFEGKSGLLAATNVRLLFATSGLIRDRVTSWPYDDLQEVAATVDRNEGTVSFSCGGATYEVSHCDRDGARSFAETVAKVAPNRAFRRVQITRDEQEARRHLEADMDDRERRLAQLERMHARGSITDEEYKANRRRLLEELGLPDTLPAPKSKVSEAKAAKSAFDAPWPETKKEKEEREVREALRDKGKRKA